MATLKRKTPRIKSGFLSELEKFFSNLGDRDDEEIMEFDRRYLKWRSENFEFSDSDDLHEEEQDGDRGQKPTGIARFFE